jgi:hypothetical protein
LLEVSSFLVGILGPPKTAGYPPNITSFSVRSFPWTFFLCQARAAFDFTCASTFCDHHRCL